MKHTNRSLTRLENMFKIAVPEKDRPGFLLGYTNGRVSSIEALSRFETEDLIDSLSKTVKLATAAQIQKLQCLYRDLKLVDQKAEMLLTYSQGRTDSTAGLTMDEARDLIQELAKNEPRERLRKSVFSFARQAGVIYGYSEEDRQINKAKLNMFLRERGTVKKDIEKQTESELKQTVAQLAGMTKNNQRSADNKQAKKATAQLLNELNLKAI